MLGDQILMFNGHDMRGKSHEQAVDWFRESKTSIKLLISRMVESKKQKGIYHEYIYF